jgi:hypothetical protein
MGRIGQPSDSIFQVRWKLSRRAAPARIGSRTVELHRILQRGFRKAANILGFFEMFVP